MKTKLRQLKIEGLQRIKIPKKDEKEAIILRMDENSYVMGACKECTQEFFERIYAENGPFWSLYEDAGFAARPRGVKYAQFVANNLYFRKNVQEKYMYEGGTEKYYQIKNNLLVEKTRWGVKNLIFILSWPFDALGQFANIIKFSFYANEMIPGYERLYRSAMEFCNFYSDEDNIYDPAKTAKEAMERAVEIMKYSIAAFICSRYGIKLKYSKYIGNCELDRLSTYIETKNTASIMDEFGFYSVNPYDISYPRIFEDTFELDKFSGFKIPEDNSVKWRENVRFVAARYMNIMRICYKLLGQKSNLGDLIFFLKTDELSKVVSENQSETENIKRIAVERKEQYERRKNIVMSPLLAYKKDKYYEINEGGEKKGSQLKFAALSVSSSRVAEGPVVNINSFEEYSKCADGSIILSKTLSPNLVVLFRKAAGIICENGGSLSHAAIIAREMNLPCLICSMPENHINDGRIVRIDGKKGTFIILPDQKKIEKETTHNEINTESKGRKVEEAIPVQISGEALVLNKNTKDDFYFLSSGKLKSKNAGNKAANLSEIFKHFNVPDGFAIDADYFRKLTGFAKIRSLIADINRSNKSDVDKLDENYRLLRSEISNVEFSRKLKEEISASYNKLSSHLVAARSSSSCEDGTKASFAGQFDSYINIGDINNLEYAIKNCWASFYSPRSVVYRKEKKIRDENANMAVLVQKMISAKYSGIAFSKDIMNNDAISIEVIPGTCEKLASGEISPNVYVLERDSLSILKVNANYDFDDNLIINIANEALKLEKFFNSPQDIEWCMDEANKIWVIQTRPITSTCNIK